MEIRATLSSLDNINTIIKRLTPVDEVVIDDHSDTMSQFTAERPNSNEYSEKKEIRTLIRKQSDIIFNLEQEILEAENLVVAENLEENHKILDRLTKKLSVHLRRKVELDSQYKMLQDELKPLQSTPSIHSIS